MTRAWSKKRAAPDPLLQTHDWRTKVRAHWMRQRLPCARCGKAIDYDGPRYLPTPPGRPRRVNPRSLAVGHKVSRRRAKLLGWTAQQVNALSNTQPECVDCSNRSGAAESNAGRSRRPVVPLVSKPVTSRDW